jgi:hypothetical protein
LESGAHWLIKNGPQSLAYLNEVSSPLSVLFNKADISSLNTLQNYLKCSPFDSLSPLFYLLPLSLDPPISHHVLQHLLIAYVIARLCLSEFSLNASRSASPIIINVLLIARLSLSSFSLPVKRDADRKCKQGFRTSYCHFIADLKCEK